MRRGILTIALLGLCGCGEHVDLHARGSTRVGVTFLVRGSQGITALRVLERDFSGGWAEAWATTGEAKALEIPYGKSPDGFASATAATPLHLHGIYEVQVEAKSGFFGGPKAKGGILFTFTQTGQVKECADVEACRKVTNGG